MFQPILVSVLLIQKSLEALSFEISSPDEITKLSYIFARKIFFVMKLKH